jgi:hypothetical protein
LRAYGTSRTAGDGVSTAATCRAVREASTVPQDAPRPDDIRIVFETASDSSGEFDLVRHKAAKEVTSKEGVRERSGDGVYRPVPRK